MAKEIVIDMKPQDNHESGIENIQRHLSTEATKGQLMQFLGYSNVFSDKFTHADLVKSIIEKARDGRIKWSEIENAFEMDDVRFCTECGQPMVAGVYADGNYYCSDECLDKGLGIEKYLELSDPEDEDNEYYYTEWD